LKPSACTPLFLAAFERGAGCCIHTHSQWCVLVTLLVEKMHGTNACFEISNIEQIKGIPKGKGKAGMLGFHDTLRVPIIENTPYEEDLTENLEQAMEQYPDTYAVLVSNTAIPRSWQMDLTCFSDRYDVMAYTFGVMTLPKQRHSVRAWITFSSWLWRCTSWACLGLSRYNFYTKSGLGVSQMAIHS
jgi:methylthioribulose-1-phosphate dehydratase